MLLSSIPRDARMYPSYYQVTVEKCARLNLLGIEGIRQRLSHRPISMPLLSIETSIKYNEMRKETDHITLPFIPDEKLIEDLVVKAFKMSRAEGRKT